MNGGNFANVNYVINISHNMMLSAGAKIVLSGGLKPQNVLFNVDNTGANVTLSGNSKLNGILLARNRTVNLTGGSTVNGSVIASRVTLSGGSQVNHPLCSP